mmetsp:Transcript_19135/g.55562  ORF Transcript_19135/g.55562 Transcript_19135/m.55562 type:complete len:323 (+) Transcript_19135:214-1182(+)
MVRRGIGLEGRDNWRLHRFNLLFRQRWQTLPLPLPILDVGDHARSLLAAHHGDLGIRPQPSEAGIVRRAVHRVVPGSVGAGEDHAELRHRDAAHGSDHLGAILGDAAPLVLGADDEACDVVQEHEGDPALPADLDEVRGLDGRLAEEHAVVPEDANWVAVDVGKAADQRCAVPRLELVEAGAVDDARDDLEHVHGHRRVLRDETKQLVGVEHGHLRRRHAHERLLGPPAREVLEDGPDLDEALGLGLREVVHDARDGRVHDAAAELLLVRVLARGGLHQGRAPEVHGAVVLDDHALVTHRGDVRRAGGAHAADEGNLRDPLR